MKDREIYFSNKNIVIIYKLRKACLSVIMFLFVLGSLLFCQKDNVYAGNGTVYGNTSGWFYVKVHVDNEYKAYYQVDCSLYGDIGGVGSLAPLDCTGGYRFYVQDGQSWVTQSLTLKSGVNIIQTNGWGWTDVDGAYWLPYNTRQYEWHFPFKTNLTGYHLDHLTGEGDNVQAWATKGDSGAFWIVSDTNGIGVTDFGGFGIHYNTFHIYLEPDQHTIKFNPNGGLIDGANADGVDTQVKYNHTEVYQGSTNWGNKAPDWTVPNRTYRTGYTLTGWYDPWGTIVFNADGSKNLNATSYWDSSGRWIGLNDVTLNAGWKISYYYQTINYYTYDASGPYNSPVHTFRYLGSKNWNMAYGSFFDAYSLRDAWGCPVGYHYWTINDNNWTVTGPRGTNSHYYPNKYRLSVDVNGGSGINGKYDMEYGTSINLGTPRRDGYIFSGWKTVNDNSSGSSLSGNSFTMGYHKNHQYENYIVSETVYIQAQWTANTYTLKFDGNGADSGIVADMTVSYDSDISLPLNGYALDRNTFVGWTLDSSAHVGTYFEGQNTLSSVIIDAAGMTNQNNAVITLYCAWDPAANISVKDKSFTLEEARNGLITEERLFEDAYAMDEILDREILPGTHDLGDGRTNSFTITNYSPDEFPQFTDSGSATITYQAVDSVGNVTEKTITVYIVNNTPQEPKSGEGTYRVRFISEKYYDKPEEEGGLMENSIWRTNPDYAQLLR